MCLTCNVVYSLIYINNFIPASHIREILLYRTHRWGLASFRSRGALAGHLGIISVHENDFVLLFYSQAIVAYTSCSHHSPPNV